MTEQVALGGSRKTDPLADEKCYPLTQDEYLTIKENLALDTLTNIETVLASTFITTLVASIVFYYTGSFHSEMLENTNETIVNWSHVRILIVYSVVSLGSLFGLIISIINKKKVKRLIQRLDKKITKHLEMQDDE